MQKNIEKTILEFTKLTGLTERAEIVNGTLYVKLLQNDRGRAYRGRACGV